MITVLYVDDEKSLLDVTKLQLERSGPFQVDGVGSARDALEKMKATPYDAVVSDYQMPVMDGIAFLKVLRAAGNKVPFIIFTGKGREEVVIEAYESGADFYVQKGGPPKSQFAELAKKIQQVVDHRRAMEELRVAQEKFAKAFLFAPDAIIITTLESGQFIEVNDAACAMFGYSREEMLATSTLDLGIWQSREERVAFITDVRVRGRVIERELVVRRKSGEQFTASVTGDTITIGNRLCLITIIRDITRRKEVEEALRESNERYKSLFDQSIDAIYIHDFEGHFLDANPAALDLIGISRDEITRHSFSSLLSGDELEKAHNSLRMIIGTGADTDLVEYRIRRKDGRSIDVETKGALVYRGGTPVGIMGIARDITRRKEAEYQGTRLLHELQVHQEELRAQNEELVRSRREVEAALNRFNDFYDFAPVGLVTLGSDNTIRQVNLAGAVLLSTVRADLVGKPFSWFVADRDRSLVAGFLARVFSGQREDYCDALFLAGNNGTVPVRIEASRSSSGEDCYLVLTRMAGDPAPASSTGPMTGATQEDLAGNAIPREDTHREWYPGTQGHT